MIVGVHHGCAGVVYFTVCGMRDGEGNLKDKERALNDRMESRISEYPCIRFHQLGLRWKDGWMMTVCDVNELPSGLFDPRKAPSASEMTPRLALLAGTGTGS